MNVDSATVALASAMGARCVVAPGRNGTVLDDLRRGVGERGHAGREDLSLPYTWIMRNLITVRRQ